MTYLTVFAEITSYEHLMNKEEYFKADDFFQYLKVQNAG